MHRSGAFPAAMDIVAIDIGGTHARFALARTEGRRIAHLSDALVVKAAEYEGLDAAWRAYEQALGRPLPRAAGIGVAALVGDGPVRLTNNSWAIDRTELTDRLGLDRCTLVNDFAAIAHAVDAFGAEHFRHLCGPDLPLPRKGIISIVGPGTGLGVAQLLRTGDSSHVIPTEGGHIGFAPADAFEERLLARLRAQYGRVSAERIVSGPGLADIAARLAEGEGQVYEPESDRALWSRALDGSDPLASAALDRFCLSLGSVAGDIALAHGARAVVIAGGLGLRLAGHLPRSGFAERFAAKGRYAAHMATIPVKIVTHPEPGLFGAAAAFVAEHGA